MWNPLRMFSEHNYRWTELDRSLTEAFEKVKTERKLVFSWLNYLRKKDGSNEKLHQQIEHELGKHDASIEDLKNQIKNFRNDSSINELKNQIEILREEVKMAKFSPNPDQVRTKSGLESEPISGLTSGNRFVNKIVSMIRPQRKDYVMQKILDMAEKSNYTTKQIETVIVREKGLCGRTAFYDYLKELRYKEMTKTGLKNGRKVLKTV